MESLVKLVLLIILIALGYFFGTFFEKKHYKSINEREKAFINLPAITAKSIEINESDVEKSQLVYGSVVISTDYFKRILASLRNIFGGRVKSYESLVDRARREAILRMKEQAPDNATIIINVRLETSSIGKSANKKNGIGSIEAMAYGTALTLKT